MADDPDTEKLAALEREIERLWRALEVLMRRVDDLETRERVRKAVAGIGE
jgi:hypothetical protein